MKSDWLQSQNADSDRVLKMLAEMIFEKINFGKQFRIYNILHINSHKKTTQNFGYLVKVFK